MDIKMSLSPKSNVNSVREENIRKRDSLFAELLNDPEFAEAVAGLNALSQQYEKKKEKRRSGNRDSTFRFSGRIPLEKRKSLRLQKEPPVYTEYDLIDEGDGGNRRKRNRSDADLDDLEHVIYEPKPKRMFIQRTERASIIAVEDVSDEMISRIATKGTLKKYSDLGTSCHQCRQKTLDQKTSCRNAECSGVRGQFCGVCLLNRYGESVAVALRDPNWSCPVCRGICNCSFCRAREGKRPTGILTPMALQSGHKSVKDFLDSLKGEGDYAENHRNPKKLLGFTKDGEFACMGGEQRVKMFSLGDKQEYLERIEAMKRNLREMAIRRNPFYGFTKEEMETCSCELCDLEC